MKNTHTNKIRTAILTSLLYITAGEAYAATQTVQNNETIKIGKLPVDSILEQLGAKQENGISKETFDHYSDHYDRVDSNKDGYHSKDEYVENAGYKTRQSRAGIFGAADNDRDGKVSKNEYILNRIITDEAKALVSAMDSDGNKKISKKEFLKNTKLSDPAVAEKVFDALDSEGTGNLVTHKYLRVWGQWARSGQDSADQRIENLENRLKSGKNPAKGNPSQTNRNGSGERPASQGDLPEGGPPEGRGPGGNGGGRPSADVIFKRFDSNGDGKLSGAEIPERMMENLDRLDKNGDKEVSREELESLQGGGGGSRNRISAPRKLLYP